MPGMRRAVFFDRDGTLNEEVGYVGEPERIRLLPGAPEAVTLVNRAGLAAVVITNQSGIARGLLSEEQVTSVNDRVLELLNLHGARVDGLYLCPHHPEGKVAPFAVACECRKPAPGLLKQAASALELDLPGSFVVGDKASDVALAVAVGAKGILVRTGYGNAELQKIEQRGIPVAYVADGVLEAAQWILHEGLNAA